MGTLVLGGLYAAAHRYNENHSSRHHAAGERLLRQMPECPEVWASVPLFDDTSHSVPNYADFPVPGPTTDIPEFHDCQRFLPTNFNPAAAHSFRYDSLYAIFASPELRTLDQRALLAPRRDPARPAIAAAQIFTFGPGYIPLGIEKNFNCLYVYTSGRRDTSGFLLLKAKMVPVAAEGKRCAHPVHPDSVAGEYLEVRRSPLGKSDSSDFPSVARWDWSETTGRHFIGLTCGAAWCEIGDSTFAAALPYARDPAVSGAHRVLAVKGWYDEQYLASANATVPTGIKGTIVPSPRLREGMPARFDTAGWDTVAYVALSGPSDHYAKKFNFSQAPVTTNLGAMTVVEMCYGTRRKCDVPDRSDPATLSTECGWLDKHWSRLPRWPQKIWWVRFTSPDPARPIMYRCLTRRTHSDGTMGGPGTVRWRFIADDETHWIDCRQGCCETETETSADPT